MLALVAVLAAGTATATAAAESEPADVDVLSQPWRSIGPAPIEPGAAGTTWTQFAHTAGRVNAVAVSPTDPDVVFIGATMGGVWRSTDGGASWTPIMDDEEVLAVNALALDPSGTLWVGTGSETGPGTGLYRIPQAEDGAASALDVQGPFHERVAGTGTTADHTSAFYGTMVRGIAIDPKDPDVMYVGVSDGHYPSDQFQVLGRAQPGLYVTKNARAATPVFSRVAVLDDADGPKTRISDLEYVGDGADELLLGVVHTAGHYGVWRTENATAARRGETPAFTKVVGFGNTGTRGDRFISLAVSGDHVYAATSEVAQGEKTQGVLHRSTNRGVSFAGNGRADPVTGSTWKANWPGWGFGSHHGVVAVDPGDPDNVYLGGEYSCRRVCAPWEPVRHRVLLHSSDGGSTFVTADGPYEDRGGMATAYVHPDTTSIAFAPSNPSIVYTGNDGGIYRASNGRVEEPASPTADDVSQVRFVSRNTPGLSITQFYAVGVHPRDRGLVLGGTQDNGAVMRATQDGPWELVGGGDILSVAVDQQARSTTELPLYVGCTRYDSVAQARAWKGTAMPARTTRGDLCRHFEMYFPGPGASAGSPSTLFFNLGEGFSTDKGQTGRFVTLGRAALGVSARTHGLHLTGTNWGELTRTVSSGDGRSVGKPAGDRGISAIAIDPTDDDVAYVGINDLFNGPRLFKTTDLGADTPSWRAMDVDDAGALELPRTPIRAIVVDPKKPSSVFVGTDAGVFASTDGGETWSPLGKGLPRGCARPGGLCLPKGLIRTQRSMAITGNVLRVGTYGRGMYDLEIRRDVTPPEIELASRVPAAGEAGWNREAVRLAWRCTDDESGTAPGEDRVERVVEAEGDVAVTARCTDRDGNTATSAPQQVRIDLTPPSATPGDPAPAPNAAGWNAGPVTVPFTCADDRSGPAAAVVEATVEREGRDLAAEGTCADVAGNTATARRGGIDIDRTPPDVRFSPHPEEVTVAERVDVLCSAEDALSGLEERSCPELRGAGWELPLGEHVLRAHAVDRAGHEARAETRVVVVVDAASLCTLTRRWVESEQVADSLCAKLERSEEAERDRRLLEEQAHLRGFRAQLAGHRSAGGVDEAHAATLSRLSEAM